MTREVELQNKCARNRNRSKRRSIYCPVHTCYLDSVSQKYPLYADRAEQLQQRGMSRKRAMLLVANQTTVSLEGEWLEAFWCDHCQSTRWYHIQKVERNYTLSIAPPELWQNVDRVVNPDGNPSVSEFTRKHSRTLSYGGINQFQFIG